MPFAILVVDRDAALEEGRQPGGIEWCFELHREQGLGLIEQETAVAVRARHQRVARLGCQRKGTFHQRLGAVEQLGERLMVEPVQDQHLCAAQQRGVELERGVLRRGADQRDRPVLDIGQEAVLLGTVEAVDLVDE